MARVGFIQQAGSGARPSYESYVWNSQGLPALLCLTVILPVQPEDTSEGGDGIIDPQRSFVSSQSPGNASLALSGPLSA